MPVDEIDIFKTYLGKNQQLSECVMTNFFKIFFIYNQGVKHFCDKHGLFLSVRNCLFTLQEVDQIGEEWK